MLDKISIYSEISESNEKFGKSRIKNIMKYWNIIIKNEDLLFLKEIFKKFPNFQSLKIDLYFIR